ncbi:hypothetical protein ALC53_12646 [Atta colombica]|uniref:Uncharacterized protein n=1 Tax=Atta colombica TaxID=520822 RepID=A0A151HZ39_9HYME|nr:hypothetical protein ALC53_12646 [Atta colombica]
MQKVLQADAMLRADADEKAESQNKETRRAVPVVAPAAEVDLVKSVYVGAAPAVKTVVLTPAAAAPTQGAGQATATVGTVTTVANPNVVVAKPAYPRWYLRKRFWTRPRKIVYVAPTAIADTQSSPSDIVGGLFANAVGDGGVVVAGKTSYATSESFIDSIFNIPISTLSAVNNAVNQLLGNNVIKTVAVAKTLP